MTLREVLIARTGPPDEYGEGPAAKNARKTHCVRGHEYTAENTYWWRGWRQCKTCWRVREQLQKTVSR